MLIQYLQRVDRDDAALPIRLYPFVAPATTRKSIVIDPLRSFGRPVLVGAGVQTQVVAARINAGESVAELALDYEMSEAQIQDALIFHQAAA